MLTIGMATYRDFDGVYFTLQGLRLYHDLRDTELLVVDNSPGSEESTAIKDVLGWFKDVKTRYIPFASATGTAAPRDLIFREAAGREVLCLDSHVLLAPGSLNALRRWFASVPESKDLVQGPMLYDDLRNYSTHFDDVWRGEMWGTWGNAWWCPCGKTAFASGKMLGSERMCECQLPEIDNPASLLATGCRPAGEPGDPAFEIPAMGLGAFACRKDAWLGFNPRFRGFGGEEWYIHEKFRRHSGKTYCLPGFRWLHRFARPKGVPYPLQRADKAWNYIVGHLELGLKLDRVRQHFVEEIGFPAQQWEDLVAEAKRGGCGCQQQQQSPTHQYEPIAQPSANQQFAVDPQEQEMFTQIAAGKVVAEYSRGRNASLTAIVLASPHTIHSHAEDTLDAVRGKTLRRDKTQLVLHKGSTAGDPVICDLLVLGESQTGGDLLATLEKHSPHTRERIAVGGTASQKEHTVSGGPGVLPAARAFLEKHPEWTVKTHANCGQGWLILTRLAEDKKPLPSTWKQGWNFLKASVKQAMTGFGDAPEELIESRLAECTVCESRNGERCGECGCPVEAKATWPKEVCPLGKWPLPIVLATPACPAEPRMEKASQ